MKYRVVKDNCANLSCNNCVMWDILEKAEDCLKFMRDNNLPDCIENECHFEEVEDTKEEDNG